MEWYLPVIWAALIGTAVALYVILDGFDLGIGILFPYAEEEHERDQMISSIAPFWDGNETWLVLGGGGLLVAFPQAYAVIMPALYLPVFVMLLALVFRGVAFEFRTVADTSKKYWTFAFAGGSTLAGFCQGLILGGLIQGIKVENGAFSGGAFDFATPFAALCGFGVVTGYALLGACWLVMKTEGPVAERAHAHAKLLLFGVLAFMAVVSLWTPYQFPRIREQIGKRRTACLVPRFWSATRSRRRSRPIQGRSTTSIAMNARQYSIGSMSSDPRWRLCVTRASRSRIRWRAGR